MKKIDLNEINWKEVQEKHNNGVYWNSLAKEFGFSKKIVERALEEGYLIKIIHKKKLSDDQKKKISIARSKYLKENPDKHPWKKNSKFKSVPCEQLKKLLMKNNILFIEEFQPSDDRFYSIDIAFPNKQIGIEINGNQHYNRDGTLKEYYINRNKYLNEIGWKIIDIHYSLIYNNELICDFISKISNNTLTIEEYEHYTKECFDKKNKKLIDENEKVALKNKKFENKQHKIKSIEANLLSSDIDFSKFGWVINAAKIINCKPSKVNSWMKKNMLEFYENKCFKKQKRVTKYCDCGKIIGFESKKCNICNKISLRKCVRPSIETIKNEITSIGITKTAIKYSVSRSTINKWIAN